MGAADVTQDVGLVFWAVILWFLFCCGGHGLVGQGLQWEHCEMGVMTREDVV